MKITIKDTEERKIIGQSDINGIYLYGPDKDVYFSNNIGMQLSILTRPRIEAIDNPIYEGTLTIEM